MQEAAAIAMIGLGFKGTGDAAIIMLLEIVRSRMILKRISPAGPCLVSGQSSRRCIHGGSSFLLVYHGGHISRMFDAKCKQSSLYLGLH